MAANLEFSSPLVQRHCMPEVTRFVCWRTAQWQLSGYKAHAGHTIEAAKEVDTDVDGECLLKVIALLPALWRIVRIERIGERNLLDIARRQKPDFVNHAS